MRLSLNNPSRPFVKLISGGARFTTAESNSFFLRMHLCRSLTFSSICAKWWKWIWSAAQWEHDKDRIKMISGERSLNLELNLIWVRSLQSALETDYGDNFVQVAPNQLPFTTTWWEIRWIFDFNVSGDGDRKSRRKSSSFEKFSYELSAH